MSLAKMYVLQKDQIYNVTDKKMGKPEQELIALAMWASEPIPLIPWKLPCTTPIQEQALPMSVQVIK